MEVITEIERVESPTREEFEQIQDRNRPVILTDVSPDWGAMRKWDPEYLKAVAGDAEITVHYDKDGNFTRWYLMTPAERDDRRIPFGELIDLLLDEEEGRRYYMTEHSLREISSELVKDVDLSGLIDVAPPWEPLLFVGRDTCMPLHYHGTTEAALCQLIGTKKITLLAPDQSRNLYARAWYKQSPLFSTVDGRSLQRGEPDFERWPRLRKARLHQFTLHPGEILFIPVHWWHLTSVPTFQVSMTCFWGSKVKRWSFPNPGMQVLAREMLWKLKALRHRNRSSDSAYG